METLKGQIREYNLRYTGGGKAVANAYLYRNGEIVEPLQKLVFWEDLAERIAKSDFTNWSVDQATLSEVEMTGYYKDRLWKDSLGQTRSAREFVVQSVTSL